MPPVLLGLPLEESARLLHRIARADRPLIVVEDPAHDDRVGAVGLDLGLGPEHIHDFEHGRLSLADEVHRLRLVPGSHEGEFGGHRQSPVVSSQ